VRGVSFARWLFVPHRPRSAMQKVVEEAKLVVQAGQEV
jgi:hypothetical protein